MSASDPTYVADILAEFLEAAQDVLDNPPERAYVGHGLPAYDCEQLVVWLAGIRPRLVTPENNCLVTYQAFVNIEVLRCVEKLTDLNGNAVLPSAEALNDDGMALAADGWALQKGLSQMWKDGDLPTGLPCGAVAWQFLNPISPQGGFGGWQLQVRIDL